VGREGGWGWRKAGEAVTGEGSLKADLGSIQSGGGSFTLVYLELLKSGGLLWGYNLINGNKSKNGGKKI
jgi:hypothetical protein